MTNPVETKLKITYFILLCKFQKIQKLWKFHDGPWFITQLGHLDYENLIPWSTNAYDSLIFQLFDRLQEKIATCFIKEILLKQIKIGTEINEDI